MVRNALKNWLKPFFACFRPKRLPFRRDARRFRLEMLENRCVPALVAHYSFDNPLNLGFDSSPNANQLVNVGTPVSTTSAIVGGGALSMNNTANYLMQGATFPTGVPTGGSAYTISVWINPSGTVQGDGIVGWGNYGTNSQVNALRTSGNVGPNDRTVHNYWWANDLTSTDMGYSLYTGDHPNGWHYIVATYDPSLPSNQHKIYVDNVLSAQRTVSPPNIGATNFAIGVTNAFTEFFEGSIDDLRIYNNAFTPTDVNTLYTQVVQSETFTSGTLPAWLEKQGPSLTLNGSQAVFSGFGDSQRTLVRTVAGDYFGKSFVAEIDVRPQGNISFFGMGTGVPVAPNQEPGPSILFRVHTPSIVSGRVDFTDRTSTGDTGSSPANFSTLGTHRLRIAWDASTKKAQLSVDQNYAGGDFVADYTSSLIDGSDNGFDGSNVHIFFGGAGNAWFDNLRITVVNNGPPADTTPPDAPVFTSISDDTGESSTDLRTKDTTLKLNGTAEANSTITVTRVGTGVIGTTTTNGSGNWSFDYTATTLANGTYQFTATATDAATNVSTPSSVFTVVVDTLLPTVSNITTTGPTFIQPGTQLTYTVTFNEDIDASTFTGADIDNGGVNPVSFTVDSILETSPGVFQVKITPTTEGTFVFRFAATADVRDVAGNSLVVPVTDDEVVCVYVPPVITSPAVAPFAEDAISFNIILSATDNTTPAAALVFTITSLPDNGTLYFGGLPVLPGQVFVGSPVTLVFTPGGCGTGVDGFSYTVADQSQCPGFTPPPVPGAISFNVTPSVAPDGTGSNGTPLIVSDPLAGGNVLYVYGTSGNDTISIVVSGLNYVITRNSGPVFTTTVPTADIVEIRVWGRAGTDNINASAIGIKTTILGGAGNDNLYGGSANDALYGGAGNDYIVGNNGADYLHACDGDDTVYGGAGADIIVGGAGNDFLYGDVGNDFFLAKGTEALADRMFGGADSDTLLNSAPAPLVLNSFSNVNQQVEFVNGLGNATLGTAGVDNLDFSMVVMIGVPYIDGLAGNDIINGTAGVDTIYGGDGSDSINGLAGNDFLYGYGLGNPAAPGLDTIHGNAGNDTLVAGAGGSNLYGDDNDDTLYGNAGIDSINGGAGNDTLDARSIASTGNDSLYGGAGDDNLIVGSGVTVVYGEDGNDTIRVLGDISSDRFNGGAGFDTLVLQGNVTLNAFNAGNLIEGIVSNNHTIAGTSFTNTLDFSSLTSVSGTLAVQGGTTSNTLTASIGADVFKIIPSSPPVTIDNIYGFANGVDKIDLTAFGPLTLSGIASQSGSDVLLLLPTGKRVLIKNFLLANLDVTDFVGGNVS